MRIQDMGYPLTLSVGLCLGVVACCGLLRASFEQAENTRQRAERIYTKGEHAWLSTCVSMGDSLWRCQYKLANLNALEVEPTP